MTLDLVLLTLFLVGALWCVLRGSLLRAAIALAVTSTFLTLLMFRLGAPLAAVFELSVCAGLITVVFVSAISLTKPQSHAEEIAAARPRIARYWPLPVLVALALAALWLFPPTLARPLPPTFAEPAIRYLLWIGRQADVLGQALALFTGIIGIIVLFAVPDVKKDDTKEGQS